jgi:hypothetical protein
MSAKNQPFLSEEETAEWHALLDAVIDDVPGSGERADRLVAELNDAEQAQRPWASEVRYHALRIGLGTMVRRHGKKRRTVLVPAGGAQVIKSAVLGMKVRHDDGTVEDQQRLLDEIPWVALEAMIDAYAATMAGYGVGLRMMRRALALRDEAPSAATPGEAARMLGTSLDAWLAEAA